MKKKKIFSVMPKTPNDIGTGGKLDWFPEYKHSRGGCGFMLRVFSYVFVFFGNVRFPVFF